MPLSTKSARALGIPPGMRFYFVYVNGAITGFVRGYDRSYALGAAKRAVGHLGTVTIREITSVVGVRNAMAKFPDLDQPKRNRGRRLGRAHITARGRRARPRKRNPLPRGSELRDTFTLSSLKAVKRGGRAEKIWYQDARDNKHYYHDFESEHGAIMYLCESAALGKCVLIVSGDLSTPLWENA